MGGAVRSFAAVLAALALVAMLPGPCPCPDQKPSPAREHGCCAPPAGVSASDHACCDVHDHAGADLLTPPPAPAASTAGIAVVGPEQLPRLIRLRHASVVPFSSPPPPVLRI